MPLKRNIPQPPADDIDDVLPESRTNVTRAPAQPQPEPLRAQPPARSSNSGSVVQRTSANLSAFGDVDQSDVVMPRLKLLQGLSPEVQQDPRNMFQGEFLHTGLGQLLGTEVKFIPVRFEKTFDLWADRDSGEQGLLAQADAKGNWISGGNSEFVMGRRKIYTRRNLAESGLDRFGSSDPNNPRSKPLIAETYRMVLWLVDYPAASPVLYITSRMNSLKTKELLTRVMYREGAGTPVHAQIYTLISAQESMKGNSFYVGYYTPAGEVKDQGLVDQLYGMAVGLQGKTVKAEGGEDGDAGPRGPRGPVDTSGSASY